MTITAQQWAAVAATFSALSSFLVMLIQRRNLLESVKPELVITEWERTNQLDAEGNPRFGELRFSGIRNVGRGPALRVIINPHAYDGDQSPAVSLLMLNDPIIAPGETSSRIASTRIDWYEAKTQLGEDRHTSFRVVLWCWDARNIRHQTTYVIFVSQQGHVLGGAHGVSDGVEVASRITVSRSVWRLKTERRIGEIWGRITQQFGGSRRTNP